MLIMEGLEGSYSFIDLCEQLKSVLLIAFVESIWTCNMKTTCVSLLCDSVLPRPFFAGRSALSIFGDALPFLNAEMTPCFFTKKLKAGRHFMMMMMK